jgi:hypothetical protein
LKNWRSERRKSAAVQRPAGIHHSLPQRRLDFFEPLVNFLPFCSFLRESQKTRLGWLVGVVRLCHMYQTVG